MRKMQPRQTLLTVTVALAPILVDVDFSSCLALSCCCCPPQGKPKSSQLWSLRRLPLLFFLLILPSSPSRASRLWPRARPLLRRRRFLFLVPGNCGSRKLSLATHRFRSEDTSTSRFRPVLRVSSEIIPSATILGPGPSRSSAAPLAVVGTFYRDNCCFAVSC
jgi:hypothetical protein